MKKLITFSLFFCLLFLGCKSTSITREFYTDPEILSQEILTGSCNAICAQEIWTPLPQPGYSITSYKIKEIGVTWHCVKIDLDTANISIIAYPNKNTLGKNYNLRSLAKKNNAVIAVNTTPFDLDGKTYLPVGITKIENSIITEPVENYCALGFTSTPMRAQIFSTQTDKNTSNCPYVFGGFFSILENGNIITFAKNKRSRVGCGISDNGRFLYIMVATPEFHLTDKNGLNYEECAIIFKYLGCTDAMQFDGGHSSGLVINGKNVEKPFLQRKVPTVLLIK